MDADDDQTLPLSYLEGSENRLGDYSLGIFGVSYLNHYVEAPCQQIGVEHVLEYADGVK